MGFSQSDDYDCDIAPPLGVEPLTCCRVSKPFDQKTFPECFDVPIVTTSTLPTIPVSEDFGDDSTVPPIRSTTDRTANDSVQGRRDDDDDENNKKDKHHGFGHWPGKYHWGYDHRHFHSDYHRFGRHRRQAIFRTTATPNVSV